jgi:hypothetical protein
LSDPSPIPPLPRPPVNAAARQRRIDEEAAADLARLSPEARQVVLARVPQNPVAELLLQRAVDYVREPVPIETFIYDDRYLGHSLKGNVFPAIVDDLTRHQRKFRTLPLHQYWLRYFP